jgi:hypothetical protein
MQDEVFPFNLVLKYVNLLKFAYEAPNMTVQIWIIQSETKAYITQYKNKREQSMTRINRQSFFLDFIHGQISSRSMIF